ncbi:MAG: site-2 protease family protein [Treponema sp.]|nr:site-2 protease family protein [Treponema sp.]MCL2238245.1 site-2 protease family protein [Treponema sp.]
MDIKTTLYVLPGIILGLTVHEFCHAYCAYKLGDNTAKDQGRLTFNPIKHIDLFGFIFIVLAGFGWAKPVEFNPANLKNLRRDKALIAAAGPLSNLILGVILTLILRSMLDRFVDENVFYGSNFLYNLYLVLFYGASINFGLFIFNLLPIPPLDGSHIAFSGLNLNPEIENKIRTIGMPALFLIIIVQNMANITIIPIGKWVNDLLTFVLHIGSSTGF